MIDNKTTYKKDKLKINKSLFTKYISKTITRQDIVSSLEEKPFKPLNRGNYFTSN